ncbi:MAG TPA: UDP binding domain-containing protein, partial [Patescibacteria group bacterium]|nr:UDP binding domain-containing protein [Patescibacteria group bacterium]
AREINNSMPNYTVELLQDALNDIRLPMKGTNVGILGISYKANVDDVRESPAIKIIECVKNYGANVLTYDPHILNRSSEKKLESILKKSQAIILVTNHNEFTSIEPKTWKKYGIKVIIDGRNCLKKDTIKKQGIIYKGIGR